MHNIQNKELWILTFNIDLDVKASPAERVGCCDCVETGICELCSADRETVVEVVKLLLEFQ